MDDIDKLKAQLAEALADVEFWKSTYVNDAPALAKKLMVANDRIRRIETSASELVAEVTDMFDMFRRYADGITAEQTVTRCVAEVKKHLDNPTGRDDRSGHKGPSDGACLDCGRLYGDRFGFPDLHVSDEDWKRISPTGDGSGLLCPSCMCRRAQILGMREVPSKFTSGPFCITQSTILRACPFCGRFNSSDQPPSLIVEHDDRKPTPRFRVWCKPCGSAGPYEGTLEEARTMWNKRNR